MAGYGLTIPLGGLALHRQRELIASLPGLGYTDVWSAEAGGADAFTPLALASVWAPELRLGTAIVPAFTRGAATIAQSAAALADAAPGRVAIGIGSSSDVIVARWNGIPFIFGNSCGPARAEAAARVKRVRIKAFNRVGSL